MHFGVVKRNTPVIHQPREDNLFIDEICLFLGFLVLLEGLEVCHQGRKGLHLGVDRVENVSSQYHLLFFLVDDFLVDFSGILGVIMSDFGHVEGTAVAVGQI